MNKHKKRNQTNSDEWVGGQSVYKKEDNWLISGQYGLEKICKKPKSRKIDDDEQNV